MCKRKSLVIPFTEDLERQGTFDCLGMSQIGVDSIQVAAICLKPQTQEAKALLQIKNKHFQTYLERCDDFKKMKFQNLILCLKWMGYLKPWTSSIHHHIEPHKGLMAISPNQSSQGEKHILQAFDKMCSVLRMVCFSYLK